MNDIGSLQVLRPSGFTMVDPDMAITQMQLHKASQLVIIRQSSLTIETVSKNGLQQRVYVVVKNQPFLVQVGLLSSIRVDGQLVDFSRFQIEARLVYDCENYKEVDFVKLKPMDVKSHVSERGDQVTVEIRAKVLTSQLEDMLFRVRLSAIHPITKKRIEQLTVYSEPVKVVSKPEQVKRKKAPVVVAKKVSPLPVAKKEPNEVLSEALAKIEMTCSQQKLLLSQISDTVHQHTNLLQNFHLEEVPTTDKKRKLVAEPELSPFEIAFKQFMAAYNNVQHEERPAKIRSAMKKTSARDAESLFEMLDRSQTEPKENKEKKDSQGKVCSCDDCPHKRELERLDSFYNEFLSTPQPTLL